MELYFQIFVVSIALAFLAYGYNCLFIASMIEEFNRLGLTPGQRRLTGILQLFGAFGLLLGFLHPAIGMAAALGLGVLMLLGFRIRLKIKDSVLKAAPSFIFMLLNAGAAYGFSLRLPA
ncbi:MAG: DoxX family protein [Bacteroidia bacterium]|nr:DoxX family protein [Bacteroidia bacterium]NNF29932.1 hypothetical protein [Flavobacteriaceae bacterium]MBT8276088.1 DoxX family protein [Bacteroidia bacterium]NNJ82479.1 hypothetical protein [Flavobacteriaceae bacterium]NNK53637.1 hypothetical protein [Flavobacteriaceae bacterium]